MDSMMIADSRFQVFYLSVAASFAGTRMCQISRTAVTSDGMSMPIGHVRVHSPHSVHAAVHCFTAGSSTSPSTVMRTNLRGSIWNFPETGHPDAHAPQVRQRLKSPGSGKLLSSCRRHWLSWHEANMTAFLVMSLSPIFIHPAIIF
jgi:hypothetical protein